MAQAYFDAFEGRGDARQVHGRTNSNGQAVHAGQMSFQSEFQQREDNNKKWFVGEKSHVASTACSAESSLCGLLTLTRYAV